MEERAGSRLQDSTRVPAQRAFRGLVPLQVPVNTREKKSSTSEPEPQIRLCIRKLRGGSAVVPQAGLPVTSRVWGRSLIFAERPRVFGAFAFAPIRSGTLFFAEL
jgi:hypothetical protein